MQEKKMPKDYSKQTNQTQAYSQEDQEQLRQASLLSDLQSHPAWAELVKPYLLNLAQQGYPQPKDYPSKEELILRYCEAVGGTNAVKTFLEMMESQKTVSETIAKKYENKEAYE